MINYFLGLNYFYQTLIACFFTWGVTALGAGAVFLFKKPNKLLLNLMLSFAAGVMIAASFFSLLLPAIELAETLNSTAYIVPTIGFLLGGMLIVFSEKFMNYIFRKKGVDHSPSKRRSFLLVSAITLHNIPEGMAIGVAFAAASSGIAGYSVIGAVLLAVGIGLQNFPEGVSVSVPLVKEGYSAKKSFFFGQLSGFVEPISGILACSFVYVARGMLPFMLSFAAGAMIGVVASELIPESSKHSKNITTIGTVVGFAVMMLMDVALG